MGPRGFLLVDANVLIDYVAGGVTVLTLASRHIGQVHVLSSVLAEVADLDEAECERLGLRVVEPTLDQALAAGTRRGRLAYQDRLCLAVAREMSRTCVTNDRALRRACAEEAIDVLWGLEVMLELVRVRQLALDDAIEVAIAIHESNPAHIPASLVEEFRLKLRQTEPRE